MIEAVLLKKNLQQVKKIFNDIINKKKLNPDKLSITKNNVEIVSPNNKLIGTQLDFLDTHGGRGTHGPKNKCEID